MSDSGITISDRIGILKDGTFIAQIKVDGAGEEFTIGPFKSREEAEIEKEKAIRRIIDALHSYFGGDK